MAKTKKKIDRRTMMARVVSIVLASLMLFSVIGAAIFSQVF